MIIAVNTCSLFFNHPDDPGYFIYQCISNLEKKHPQHQFIFLFDRPFDKQLTFAKNSSAVVMRPRPVSTLLWPYWYNFTLPAVLRKYKATVYISTDGICAGRTKLPQCLLLQDLTFLHAPEYVAGSLLRFYKKQFSGFLKKAKSIVTLSAFSQTIIADRYKIDAKKISIIYPAPTIVFKPVEEAVKEAVKAQYTDGKEFFLYTGAIHPRNNLVNLLKAFSFFKKRQKSNMQLLIAGTPDKKFKQFAEDLKTYRYRDEVKILSGLPVTELAEITAAAYAFIFPVLFDNFTHHPLNAMQSAVPVITSKCCALPETCADAALYVNPEDFKDLAEKMMLLYKDEQKRNQLISTGLLQAKKYNWDNTANLLWELIARTIEY